MSDKSLGVSGKALKAKRLTAPVCGIDPAIELGHCRGSLDKCFPLAPVRGSVENIGALEAP